MPDDRSDIEIGGRHADRPPTSVQPTERSADTVSYRVATVDELQDIPYRQDTHMRPVRHHLGITAFGTNAWTSTKEGDRLMPEHAEDEGVEELYVVLRGHARFEIDGDSVDAPAGALIFV